MQVLGFNLTKISASRSKKILQNPSMNTNIEFTDVQSEEVEALKGDEAVRFTFKFSVDYAEHEGEKEKKKDKTPQIEGTVEFEGIIMLSASKEETKETLKLWKKKQVSDSLRIPLFNFILKKCSPKALELEDQIGLPLHLPFPQIKPSPKEQ